MIIRNDDVAADTTLREIQTFCEICDRHGVTPMHAITPIGRVRGVDYRWSNAEIRERTGTALFGENTEVVEYLLSRDRYAVHGLWHTHEPSWVEVDAAYSLLRGAGFSPSYYTPPFNEGPAFGNIAGLDICGAGVPRLEEFLDSGDPGAEIVYLHSWRFEYGPFTWEQLDQCLKRLTRR